MRSSKSELASLGFDDTQLNKLYVKAKITADPHNYTLKDRALAIDPPDRYGRMTSIFRWSANTECKLYGKLGVDVNIGAAWDPKGFVRFPKTHKNEYAIPGYLSTKQYQLEEIAFRNVSHFYKHNDLLINDSSLGALITASGAEVLEPALRFHVALNRGDSIFPQLAFGLFPDVASMELNDVVNLRFARERIEKGTTALLAHSGEGTMGIFFTGAYMLGEGIGDPGLPFRLLAVDYPGYETWYQELMAEITKLNIREATYFMCEAYRVYRNLSEDDQQKLGDLLFLSEPPLSPIGSPTFVEAFGKYNVTTKRIESPRLDSIIALPADERFHAAIEYGDEIMGVLGYAETMTGKEYLGARRSLAIPEFLARVFSEMHFKAYQDYRVKHFALLLQMCEENGIDVKDLKEAYKAASDGTGIPLAAGDPDEDGTRDFGDMSLGTEYEDEDDDDCDEDDEDSASSADKPSSESPTLETMDNLLNGCDTKYKIKVKEVLSDVRYKAAYDSILTPIDMITKQLTKQIREIKTYNVGGKHSGKMRGRVDPHTMYRYKTDPKIFYDNTYKVKEMDLAFGIILDQSGSMYGSGIADGKIALILLHHVLNALRVNHSIIGHTSHGYHDVEIMRYVLFNEDKLHTLNQPYVLANLKHYSGNCDSGALNYMEQYIKRVRNKDRIVLIFSDGEPTECSETELRNQVRKMEREGIHVIGLGINFENIRNYYPDCANGRNMKEMVDILVSILKRYVLEKKE